MNFQRSQSKVWYGGSQQNSAYDNFYSLPTYYNAGKKSLQSISEQHEESLSPKSECDELKRSLLLWGNRKSPSSHSHKSQVKTNFKTAKKNLFHNLQIIINRIQDFLMPNNHRRWVQIRKIFRTSPTMTTATKDRHLRAVKSPRHQPSSVGRQKFQFMKKSRRLNDFHSANLHRPTRSIRSSTESISIAHLPCILTIHHVHPADHVNLREVASLPRIRCVDRSMNHLIAAKTITMRQFISARPTTTSWKKNRS